MGYLNGATDIPIPSTATMDMEYQELYTIYFSKIYNYLNNTQTIKGINFSFIDYNLIPLSKDQIFICDFPLPDENNYLSLLADRIVLYLLENLKLYNLSIPTFFVALTCFSQNWTIFNIENMFNIEEYKALSSNDNNIYIFLSEHYIKDNDNFKQDYELIIKAFDENILPETLPIFLIKFLQQDCVINFEPNIIYNKKELNTEEIEELNKIYNNYEQYNKKLSVPKFIIDKQNNYIYFLNSNNEKIFIFGSDGSES